MPISGNLKPLTFWTVLLNRHYVNKELKIISSETANELSKKFPNSKLNYLDANFPFLNGFPLIPHLSHNDGKKLDLAFCYLNGDQRSSSAPSFIGYGAYESPKNSEIDYPSICRDQGYWQYDLIGKLISTSKNFEIDEERTRFLIVQLSKNPQISKIFIEPHLKERWKLSGVDKIRFHGCQAVRHDDHIHLQIN